MSINSIIYILSYFNVGIFFVEARSWPRLTIQNLAFVVPEHISALPPLTYPTTKHAQLRGKPESEHLTHLTYYEMLHISGTVFLRFRPCWKLRIALHPSFRSSSVQVVAKPSGHRVSYRFRCVKACQRDNIYHFSLDGIIGMWNITIRARWFLVVLIFGNCPLAHDLGFQTKSRHALASKSLAKLVIWAAWRQHRWQSCESFSKLRALTLKHLQSICTRGPILLNAFCQLCARAR